MSDSVDTELPTPCTEDRSVPFLPYPSIRFVGDRPAADVRTSQQPQNPPVDKEVNVEVHAVERLVKLKRSLRVSESEVFWDQLMGDLTSTCGAQFGFVVRKAFPAGERIRETGQHWDLQGVVLYYNDGHRCVGIEKDRDSADGIPFAHMDDEKLCLVPNNLGSLFHFGEDKMPFAAEACLSIPLFSQGRCLAHLGLMWSEDGLRNLTLPWLSLEMALYSLEDLVVQRLLNETRSSSSSKTDHQHGNVNFTSSNQKIVRDAPHAHIRAPCECSIQPFEPYARSLSHELRTPMQGVVGMLDVMHATVRDAMRNKNQTKTNDVFHFLKESIEMIQDSARRAVEAADNVVHAYDLNMQVPETPQKESDGGIFGGVVPSSSPAIREDRPNVVIEGSNITMNPCKRRRSNSDRNSNTGPALKKRVMQISPQEQCSPRSQEVKDAVHESEKIMQSHPSGQIEEAVAKLTNPRPSLAVRRSAPHLLVEGLKLRDPALKLTQLRDLLRLVVNESLQVGGRPDFAVCQKTQFGEKIEACSRFSNGGVSSKVIDWSVDPAFPDTFFVDNRDLAKLVSCVFLNAIKFTNTGTITVFATVSPRANNVSITVRDTGAGIPETFLPNLFKPFSRQDTSTTQNKDGLGLGLLVAKGLARRMGGDLLCVRSSTTGPDRGSVFEIILPANQLEASNNKPPITPAASIRTPASSAGGQLTPDTMYGSSPKKPLSRTFSPSRLPNQSQPIQQPSPCLTDGSASPASSCSMLTPGNGRMTAMNGGDGFDSKLGKKHPLTFLVAEDNRINRCVLVNMLKKLGYEDTYEACDGKEAVHIMQDLLESHYSEMQVGEKGDFDDDMTATGDLRQRSFDKYNNQQQQQQQHRRKREKKARPVDAVLMDLWMPEMDGYQATSRIFELVEKYHMQYSSLSSGHHRHRHQKCEPPIRRPILDDGEYTTTKSEKEIGGLHSHTHSHLPPVSPPPSPTVLAVSADVTDEALERASKVGIKGYMSKPYKLADLEKLIVKFCGG